MEPRLHRSRFELSGGRQWKLERPAVCVQPDTWPATIANRPSLPRIAYRIGTYVDARRHLRCASSTPTRCSRRGRDGGADDPGIALYEGAAQLVDNLTFYQEVYANEAFVRTATWPESVADLVRLTGYQPAPGVGGLGTFVIEATGTAPVVVPAGTGITANLADDPAPANFQTSARDATALPWLSRFSPVRPQAAPVIENGLTRLVVQDPAQTFTAGDRADRRVVRWWHRAIAVGVRRRRRGRDVERPPAAHAARRAHEVRRRVRAAGRVQAR